MAQNIRLMPYNINVGSPSTQFAFPQKVNAFIIDNQSSTPLWANTDTGPNSGSISIGSAVFVPGDSDIAIDCACGSVTLCASGAYASGVNIIGLG